jgi:hypothetical protein
MCTGGNPGTCTCTNTKTCTSCSDNGKLDQCGKPLACTCPNGDPNHNICDPSGTAANVDGFGCCEPYSATNLPPGWAGHGTTANPLCTPPIADGCGGSFSIPCPGNNPVGNSPTNKSWPNVKCVIQPGGYGLCECTPDACPNTDTDDDGCGNVPMCHG